MKGFMKRLLLFLLLCGCCFGIRGRERYGTYKQYRSRYHKQLITITLIGASGVSTVTPRFDFTEGTVKVYVEGIYIKDLTSGVEDSISLTVGQTLEYIASDWDSIYRIDITGDKVSGDVSSWVLPNSLVFFSISSTSISGDISGWILPNSLGIFYVHYTSVFGDVSMWTLPNSLAYFQVHSTSLSGNISGWTLPNSLVFFIVNSTSLSGNISGWTLPNSLVAFYVNSTSLDYDSSTGAFTGVTDNLEKIDFDNCTLDAGQVDNVLEDLVASNITSTPNPKTLDIIDGTNAAPSNDGIADIATLISRGWTITGYDVIRLTGAATVTAVTPKFDFTSGTVKVYIDGAYEEDLTSGAEANIALAVGEVIEYVASDWDAITRIDINSDKVSWDISGLVLPTSLTRLYVHITSVFGDISGLVLPNSLVSFYANNTLISGDVSGLVLSNSLQYFLVNNTPLDYDSATGAFEGVTDNLTKIDFDDCNLDADQVGYVLLDLVTSNITNSVSPKTLDLAGTNAAPTGAGITNATHLRDVHGWTVNTN